MNWQSEALQAPGSAKDSASQKSGGAGETVWTIGEIQALAGVSARTLRYYEELGLLPGVRRRAGGRRVYGPDELERLRFIQRLKALGLSLAEIKDLNAVYAIGGSTASMLGRLEELLAHHSAEVDRRVEELQTLRTEIDRYRDHIRERIEEPTGRTGRKSR